MESCVESVKDQKYAIEEGGTSDLVATDPVPGMGELALAIVQELFPLRSATVVQAAAV